MGETGSGKNWVLLWWAMFSKALIQLSANGWSCTPSLPRGSQVALVVKILPANAGDIRDTGSVPGLGRFPGGGHSNLLQYSCLENPTDRGACQVTVHGVAKGRTRLKQLSTHALILCYIFKMSTSPLFMGHSFSREFV